MPRAGERIGETEGRHFAPGDVGRDLRRASMGAARHIPTKSARAATVPPTTAPAWPMPAKPVGMIPPATPSPIKPIAILTGITVAAAAWGR
jgi:hypothetical protein